MCGVHVVMYVVCPVLCSVVCLCVCVRAVCVAFVLVIDEGM